MAIYGNMVVPSKAAGGALPTDNSDRNVYVPGSEVSGRFSDQGVVIAGQGAQKAAESLGNLGKGLGQLAGMGMALYTRQRRIEHAEALEAVSRLQTEYVEKQREWSQIKGANAIGMEELKSRWWDEAMPRYTEGLSDYGKRYFNLNADRIGAQADTFIQDHQEREIKGYEDQQFKLAMDAEGNQIAANIDNPAAVQASLGRLRALWDRQCLRDGTPDDAREAGWQAMVGKAMSGAIGTRISMGDLDGAQRLIMQYGGNISPEDYAKLRQSWASGQMSELAGLAGAGKVDAIRQRLSAGGAVTLQQRLSQAAVMKVGEKYTWGNNDCSGHTCQVWQATLGDSPAKTAIFGKDGEHVTAAEIMRRASDYTKQLYSGAQINSSSVKGGWLLASTSRSPNGRWHNIHHVVTTVEQPDGSIWVSEALGGQKKDGQVQLIPLDKFLMRYQGRVLFGVDLSSLQPGQAGAQQGGQVPSGRGGASGGAGDVLPQYAPIMDSMAQRFGIEPSLLRAVAMVESDGGRDLRTSGAGAVGVMQIMPVTARYLKGNPNDTNDNVRMGAQYLAEMVKKYKGNLDWALQAYNWGPTNMDSWINNGHGIKTKKNPTGAMPEETRAYPGKVRRYLSGLSGAPAQSQPAQAGAPYQSQTQGFQLTPAEQQKVQNDIEPQAYANNIWKRLETLPLEQLDAGLAKELDAFSDNPTMQAKISHYLTTNVNNRKKLLEAESNQRVADCAANIKNDNYLGAANTVSQLVANKKLTEKEGALALEQAFGKKEDNTKSRSAAFQVCIDIDSGRITSRQQVEAACLAGRCTEAQTKQCLEYLDKGGQAGQVKLTRIDEIWKEWKSSRGESVGTGQHIPWKLANYVYADMTPGKIPSSKEIKASIAEGMLKGVGFGSNYAYEAWADKKEDWEIYELPPAFGGDRDAYRDSVKKWILANVSGVTENDITAPMIRAAAREMMGMPRWGLDWRKVNKGGSR